MQPPAELLQGMQEYVSFLMGPLRNEAGPELRDRSGAVIK